MWHLTVLRSPAVDSNLCPWSDIVKIYDTSSNDNIIFDQSWLQTKRKSVAKFKGLLSTPSGCFWNKEFTKQRNFEPETVHIKYHHRTVFEWPNLSPNELEGVLGLCSRRSSFSHFCGSQRAWVREWESDREREIYRKVAGNLLTFSFLIIRVWTI